MHHSCKIGSWLYFILKQYVCPTKTVYPRCIIAANNGREWCHRTFVDIRFIAKTLYLTYNVWQTFIIVKSVHYKADIPKTNKNKVSNLIRCHLVIISIKIEQMDKLLKSNNLKVSLYITCVHIPKS